MGWWIACGVLIALSLLPLGIRVGYDSGGLTLRVIAGPVKVTVFPGKKKPKKSDRKPKKKQPEAVSAAQEDQPPQPPKQEPNQEQNTGGSLTQFLPLVKLGLDFLGDFRRKIRLDNLYLRLMLACDDPCDLAVNYGRTWAAVGNLLPTLERVFVIKKRDIQVACDFTAEETRVIARGDITITLGRLLSLTVSYGIRALKEFLAIKRKGGAVK
ncbi:MAG: hypothetical protein ACI3V1_02995 [Faecousia sp.]